MTKTTKTVLCFEGEEFELKPIPPDHTPTPWVVDGSDILHWPTPHEGEHVCVGTTYQHQNEDAAFIVRAVNSHAALVEALEAAKNRFEQQQDEGTTFEEVTITLDEIRAALTLAKGA